MDAFGGVVSDDFLSAGVSVHVDRAIVRRETNSWRRPLFMVSYMLVLAYMASLITFQGGRLLALLRTTKCLIGK